jgi:hypothetical protein
VILSEKSDGLVHRRNIDQSTTIDLAGQIVGDASVCYPAGSSRLAIFAMVARLQPVAA